MSFQIRKRGDRGVEVQSEFVLVGDDVVIGSSYWLDVDGNRQGRYQVLTVRGGKIVDLQGCRTRRQAERFAARRR